MKQKVLCSWSVCKSAPKVSDRSNNFSSFYKASKKNLDSQKSFWFHKKKVFDFTKKVFDFTKVFQSFRKKVEEKKKFDACNARSKSARASNAWRTQKASRGCAKKKQNAKEKKKHAKEIRDQRAPDHLRTPQGERMTWPAATPAFYTRRPRAEGTLSRSFASLSVRLRPLLSIV